MASDPSAITPLSVSHPFLALEADGWDPSRLSAGSNRRVQWKCSLGHIWRVKINSRTSFNTGCPFCSNHRVQSGFNDLATKYPEIALQAHGWDPGSVLFGSNAKMTWRCSQGHVWSASVTSRVFRKTGCPFCARRFVLPGFSDLATTHPIIASEADGWSPSEVLSGHSKQLPWRCSSGHTWKASPSSRTHGNTGCPYCVGRLAIKGENDLATLHPEIAQEADGWSPEHILPNSNKKLNWKCALGHKWRTSPNQRQRSGCPYCGRQRLLRGFNDLATTDPHLAQQAYGWNPSEVIGANDKKVSWKCTQGHIFSQRIADRRRGKGCGVCANKQVMVGVNDLKTTHPDLANEADGWDPTTVVAGKNSTFAWKCLEGHKWVAKISNRVYRGENCPSCASYGFDPNKPAWLYLLEHHDWDLLQIGITNSPKTRLLKHESRGWTLIDLRGPMDGHLAKSWEKSIIGFVHTLVSSSEAASVIEPFDGYTEAWEKKILPASTVAEIMNLVVKKEDHARKILPSDQGMIP